MNIRKTFLRRFFIQFVLIGILISMNGNSIAFAFQFKSVKPERISQTKTSEDIGIFNETSVLDIRNFGWTEGLKETGFPTTRLSIGVNAGNEIEPNNTFDTATPLSGSEVKIRGDIIPNGDIDFFSFSAPAGARVYAATMTSQSGNGSVDSQLDIIDTDGTTVIENDNDDGSIGSTSSSIAGATLTTGGTYYARVRHNSATSQLRPYYLYLSVRSGSPAAEMEPNDTTGTATPLAGGWASGETSSATDQDWYSFSANAGDTIFASVDLDPERDATTWNGGLGIGVFGGFILTVNDANATSPNSEAEFMTVQDSGTYYVRVATPTGGTTFGTYQLNVTIIPGQNPAGGCTTYTSTDVPQMIPDTAPPILVSSSLNIPDSKIIEKIRVAVDLDHTLMQHLDVHLVSPSGNDNGLFTDIGSSTANSSGLTHMDVVFDDDAAIPIGVFTVVNNINFLQELNYRLDWYHGENAQGTWRLDIRDDTSGEGGMLNGWSIEVCEGTPPAGSLIYNENFEPSMKNLAGDGGYTHSGTQDEWEYGTPNTAATTTSNPVAEFMGCNNGSLGCWKTDLDNTYNASSNQDLVSPNINLTGASGPLTLSWAMRYQIESATFDRGTVTIREVGNESNARMLWQYTGATMTSGVGSPTTNIGESAGWGTYNYDISDFAGLNVELVFNFTSDSSINLGGLAIDDVQIRGSVMSNNDGAISGRVVDSQGKGIPYAAVTVDDDGTLRTLPTNPLGYFYFNNLTLGGTYTLETRRKGYTFAPQMVTINDPVTGVTITGTHN